MKIDDLNKKIENSKILTKEEKRQMTYFLSDEDFVNERFAMVELVEIILKYSGDMK